MTGGAAAAFPQAVTTDRQTRKRPAIIIEEPVENVIRIYDGQADNALPTVQAALSSYQGQHVCVSIVAATRLEDLAKKLGTSGTLEERMRKRLAELEVAVARLDKKSGTRRGLTCEEYDALDASAGAITEFKLLLGDTL
jgi:hypothetical protein